MVTIKEKDYVRGTDGRLIPLHLLSSGQQEALPLFVMLIYASSLIGQSKRTIFIEEPEAHLFPEAQSTLLELLVRMTNQKTQEQGTVPPELFITTHSPYVLLQLNNFLKAGALARDDIFDNESLYDIVPKDRLLRPDDVQAYAIREGVLKDIKSCRGLIDADYIDSVTDQMMGQFTALIDWEGENML